MSILYGSLLGAHGPSLCYGGGLWAPFSLAAGGWHSGPYEAASEQGFKRATILADCSASGLSLRLPWRVAVGVKLCMVVCLTTDPCAWTAALCVAVRGVVWRVEPRPDGTYGVGVAFTHHRFL